MRIPKLITIAASCSLVSPLVNGQTKHNPQSQYPSYKSLVMCGYQGWFRAADDGSGRGWVHYGINGRFDKDHCKVDFWPEVTEYAKTYPTSFQYADGSKAYVFSSRDESTVDLHFRWMKEYDIDGVFVQRFFGVTKSQKDKTEGSIVLRHALKAAQKYDRALAVMYDLSGLAPAGEDCSSIINDWKYLVDGLKVTNFGDKNNYLYHNGKPLVAIWGLGFPDRPYNIREIGIDKLIDFLKSDPVYGGCAIMLGVPTYWRTLGVDCNPDPYLHGLIRKADLVMPWMVQRFTPLLHNETERYHDQIKADLAWCVQHGVEYVPNVYPGFSWHNLSKHKFKNVRPLNAIPRENGKFYWSLIATALEAGANMLYVAMFDEIDEGTAIFKCASKLPVGEVGFVSYGEVPSDHYLWLTGKASAMLKKKIPWQREMPERK